MKPVSLATAKKVREMMLDVASPEGTARRAAIEGVKIAGKTGTAQKQVNGVWQPGAFRASFVGIVPADDPKCVIYVMLDFDKRAPYHQGGNSAGPVWRRIAMLMLGLKNRAEGIPLLLGFKSLHLSTAAASAALEMLQIKLRLYPSGVGARRELSRVVSGAIDESLRSLVAIHTRRWYYITRR